MNNNYQAKNDEKEMTSCKIQLNHFASINRKLLEEKKINNKTMFVLKNQIKKMFQDLELQKKDLNNKLVQYQISGNCNVQIEIKAKIKYLEEITKMIKNLFASYM